MLFVCRNAGRVLINRKMIGVLKPMRFSVLTKSYKVSGLKHSFSKEHLTLTLRPFMCNAGNNSDKASERKTKSSVVSSETDSATENESMLTAVACGLLGVGAFLLGARMALVAARGIVVAGTYTGGMLFPAFGACSLAGAVLVALRMKNKNMGPLPWILLAASPVLCLVTYLVYRDETDASNQRLVLRALALAKARTGLKPQRLIGNMAVEAGGDIFSTRMVLAQQLKLPMFQSASQKTVNMDVEAVRDYFWQSFAVSHITLTAQGFEPVVIPINEVFDPQY